MKGLILLSLLLLVNKPTQGQSPSADFTESEFFQALSWGMSSVEAKRLSTLLTHSTDPKDSTVQGERGQPVAVQGLNDDFLLLLSLVSPATNEKVERYRSEQAHGRPLTAKEQASWQERRDEYRRRLVAAGKIRP